jgi:hypothetical protein
MAGALILLFGIAVIGLILAFWPAKTKAEK